MKCTLCDGKGEYMHAIGGYHPCEHCNGTGEIEVTNEEWRKTCSMEDFAEWMAQYCCDVNTSDVKEILKNEWLEWLKQPHREERKNDLSNV